MTVTVPDDRGALIAKIAEGEARAPPLWQPSGTKVARATVRRVASRRMFPSRSLCARRKLLKSLVPVAGIEPATY